MLSAITPKPVSTIAEMRSLARIRPKSKPEAIAVFRYLVDCERLDDSENESILMNLIG